MLRFDLFGQVSHPMFEVFFRRMFFSVGFLINRSSESPVSGSTVPDFFFAKIVFEPFDPGKRLASVMYKILIFYPI